MKKILITLALFITLILFISIGIIIEYFDQKMEVTVTNRSIDLTGVNLDTVVYLSGDMTSDLIKINKIANLIEFDRFVVFFDTITGLPYSEWQSAEVTVNVYEGSDIYDVYLADVLSKYRFCDGSNIVSMGDTLYSACINENGMVMKLPSKEFGPYYSLEINIDTTDMFLIHKEYADSIRFKFEKITINDIDLLDECGIELLNEHDNNIANRLYGNCRKRSNKIDTISDWSGFVNMVTVNRKVDVSYALGKIKHYKEKFDKDYEDRYGNKKQFPYKNTVWRVK